MRRFIIGGNWKCNQTVAQTEALINNVYNKLVFDPKKGQVVVSPIFLHLPWVKTHVSKTVEVAAQNSSLTGFGAYTGEVSVQHLKDLGIPWVILGHSERRTYYGETDQVVGKKVRVALDGGLSVMACIGEKLEERKSGQTMNVVQKQLDAIRTAITKEQWKNVVIAYEPVWAIGTGQVASTEQAQEVHGFIRKYLTQVSSDVSAQTRIMYGGSVTEKNAPELAKQADIDGFLVGGASLKAGFKDIVEAFNKA